MRSHPLSEFVYQLMALCVAVIVVHVVYVTVVWPQAAIALAAQAEAIASGAPSAPSLWIILKDYEQESCFVLLLWATAIIAHKARLLLAERGQLGLDFLPRGEGLRILAADARHHARPLEVLTPTLRQRLLPRVLATALDRFAATGRVQDVATAVREMCESEAARLDSELAMIRYIAWAIPSIGFIGTVRGIGMALSQAHRAVAGDIAGVTEALGVAFNSTFVALVLSLVLMFFLHQLQLLQERFVLDAQDYCDTRLVRHLAED